MGPTHVTVALKGFDASNGSYEADFLVDTGATGCLASASELKKIGVREVGRTAYELANVGESKSIHLGSSKSRLWER